MKSIDQANFKGNKVLVRVDYNVPMGENFEVTDITRIQRTFDTVTKITKDGGIAILMSHFGRPKGVVNDSLSFRHIVSTISGVFNQEVIFLGDVLDVDVLNKVNALKPGDIGLLENLRFHPEEEKGDLNFAKEIARLGDIYVNDAFGTAHREHASTATIARLFPKKAYAGYLLYNEALHLDKILKESKKPFTAIIGGSKVSSKINILNNLLTKVDNLIIAGGMSYTFLSAMGVEIGDSIWEPDMIEVAKDIIKKAHLLGVNIYLPIDNICADKFDPDANIFITTENNIPQKWMGMDIGPKTIQRFANVIKDSNSILWNGPVGVFEFDKFSNGTKSIALVVSSTTIAGAFSLVGGGDSIAALAKYKLTDNISYISTGGGAMLEYLEGIELPGIKALNEN